MCSVGIFFILLVLLRKVYSLVCCFGYWCVKLNKEIIIYDNFVFSCKSILTVLPDCDYWVAVAVPRCLVCDCAGAPASLLGAGARARPPRLSLNNLHRGFCL